MSSFWQKSAAGYLLKSTVRLVLVIAAVSVISFVLVSESPIDPIKAYVGEVGLANMNEETYAKFQAYFGTDIPPVKRYLNWAHDFIRGDMGQSLLYRQPVTGVIKEKFANSMALMALAWVFSGIVAFVLGVLAGVFKNSALDKIIKNYALVLASAPTFWLALIALMVFSVWLRIFPIGFSVPLGVAAADVTVWDSLYHLALPALTLSLTGIASITLHTREKVIDVMGEDYILYARARGQRLWPMVTGHVIRNVTLPAITLQFASISEIFGGSVLVEQVFSFPGLGQAAVRAGIGGDAPLLLGIAIISAALVFGGNLLANLLYGLIDPKIRRQGRAS
ncbi:MAG: ABC transporter permease [Deltaproteobacteria bacterium]|jgi:peptide/nickel transport system permease protein|nr:ABC transporter permease [Deltaproteobacteria bacterium]